jgi:hypothetical protein
MLGDLPVHRKCLIASLRYAEPILVFLDQLVSQPFSVIPDSVTWFETILVLLESRLQYHAGLSDLEIS